MHPILALPSVPLHLQGKMWTSLFFLTFQGVQLSCRLGPQKYPVALRSSRRGPPLGISAVEPIQEREGAKVLVKLEVVEVVVLAGLEEGQVVPGVLNQGVDYHVGVPGNLNDCGGASSSDQASTEHFKKVL